MLPVVSAVRRVHNRPVCRTTRVRNRGGAGCPAGNQLSPPHSCPGRVCDVYNPLVHTTPQSPRQTTWATQQGTSTFPWGLQPRWYPVRFTGHTVAWRLRWLRYSLKPCWAALQGVLPPALRGPAGLPPGWTCVRGHWVTLACSAGLKP